jgi:hypothetical protein
LQVTFHVEGGIAHFPGLARDATLDTAQLAPGDAERLTTLIRAVLPGGASERQFDAPSGAADYQTWVISVEDGSTSRVLTIPDVTADSAARELIDFLRAHG